jgi:hypothetical protein
MKNMKTIAITCLTFLCFLSCASVKTLSGRVQIFGNEPHTYAGIVAGDKAYAIYPPEKEAELRLFQGQDLLFTVRFLEKPQGYGSLFLTDGCVTPISWRSSNNPSR